MRRSMRKKLIAGATAAATLVAGAAAIAASDSDEARPEPAQHGTFGEDLSAQGDTFGGLKLHNVDPASLVPGDESYAVYKLSSGNCLRGNGQYYAPVEIPHDAEVASVIASINDNDGAGQVVVELRGRDFGTPAAEDLFTGATGSTETPGRTTLTLDSAGATDEVLDKNTETFFAYVDISSETPNLEVCNIQVLYDPPEGGLEFHPVTPCAVFDTRHGLGRKLTDGETIHMDTIASDYSSQGGQGSSCGIPSAQGSSLFGDGEVQTSAVAVNLVAIQPSGQGNLRAWEQGGTAPSGGLLTYSGGDFANSNEMAVEVSGGSLFGGNGGGITVEVNGSDVHVRAVIVGYYTPVNSRW